MSGILQSFAYGRAFTSAPVNTVAPVVSGTATFGQTLSCTTGTWTGIPTPTYTYQWQRVTTPISGATSSTYVLVQADVGSTIRCVVTATNSVAAVSANSNSTATVAATVPGAPTIGTATATGSTTATVTYTAPASNGGATITSYTATSSPGSITGTLSTSGSGTITITGLSENTSYTFTVKATNSVGQSAASSASNSITTPAGYWVTYLGNRNTTWNPQSTVRFSTTTFGFDVTASGYTALPVLTSPSRGSYFGILTPSGTRQGGYYASSPGASGYYSDPYSVANLNVNKSSADYCVVMNGAFSASLWNATTGASVGRYTPANAFIDNKGSISLSSSNTIWTCNTGGDDKAGTAYLQMNGSVLNSTITLKTSTFSSGAIFNGNETKLNTIRSDNSVIQIASNYLFAFTADCASRTAIKNSSTGESWGLGAGVPKGLIPDSSNNLYLFGDPSSASARIMKMNSALTSSTRYTYSTSICGNGYAMYADVLYVLWTNGGTTMRVTAITTSTMAVSWSKTFAFSALSGYTINNLWTGSEQTGVRANSSGVFVYVTVPVVDTGTTKVMMMRLPLSGPTDATYNINVGDATVVIAISNPGTTLQTVGTPESVVADANTWGFSSSTVGTLQTPTWASNASVLPTVSKTTIT